MNDTEKAQNGIQLPPLYSYFGLDKSRAEYLLEKHMVDSLDQLQRGEISSGEMMSSFSKNPDLTREEACYLSVSCVEPYLFMVTRRIQIAQMQAMLGIDLPPPPITFNTSLPDLPGGKTG